jgi:hypothetical protein
LPEFRTPPFSPDIHSEEVDHGSVDRTFWKPHCNASSLRCFHEFRSVGRPTSSVHSLPHPPDSTTRGSDSPYAYAASLPSQIASSRWCRPLSSGTVVRQVSNGSASTIRHVHCFARQLASLWLPFYLPRTPLGCTLLSSARELNGLASSAHHGTLLILLPCLPPPNSKFQISVKVYGLF